MLAKMTKIQFTQSSSVVVVVKLGFAVPSTEYPHPPVSFLGHGLIKRLQI